jgi:hypothetical protein
MALSMFHVDEIGQGIRNLCQGRVLLKQDAAEDDTVIKVGRVAGSNGVGQDLYGTGMFRNYTTAVEIVQPGVTNTPGDIEYSETLTIVDPVGNPLHLTLAGDATLENAYTVARGAYVRPVTLPSVCTGLKMIIDNFLEGVVDPEEKFFPGVYVTWEGSQYTPVSNSAYTEDAQFLVRYAMLGGDGSDSQAAAITNVGQLLNLLRESNDLGGNVAQSSVVRILPCWTELARQHFRQINVDTFQKVANRRLFWVDMHIECSLTVTWDKVSVYD